MVQQRKSYKEPKQLGKRIPERTGNFTKAIRYLNNNRALDAIELFKKQLKQFEFRECWLNLGAAYMTIGEHDKAILAIDKAMQEDIVKIDGKLAGMNLEAYLNRGLIEYHLERDDDAIMIYREGLQRHFDYNLVWNYSNARLRQYCSGKYSDLKYCWQLYESRFQIWKEVVVSARTNWTGGFVDSITVLAEQGIGDNIMFARYLPYLKKYCNRLVVQCDEKCTALFPYETFYGNTPETTHSIAMCSLGNILDHIPNGKYIEYNKERSGKLKIGCNWSSNNGHANAGIRNVDVTRMLELEGELYSINPEHALETRITHLPTNNWADTINNIRKLDLVVTIDSSIAHLCGAMGVDCLVLMPLFNSDWRWGDSSIGMNNIWYDSVKVIRNHNNWDAVFDKVKEYVRNK